MPYAPNDRIYNDADGHIMETPDWLIPFADEKTRSRLEPIKISSVPTEDGAFIERMAEKHKDEDYRAQDVDQVMLRKNYAALGSFLKEDRSLAMDNMGFARQLIFNTFISSQMEHEENYGDVDLAYGMAEAHNRGMIDFCSSDKRLLSSCYIPLRDFDRAAETATAAIRMGASSLLIPSACPNGHSPSHIGLQPVWSQAEEADIPIVFHVGGGGQLIDPNYFECGLPKAPDFHGGAENFRSIDYMAIPNPPMQTLSTMIFDGVFEHFPSLKCGVIEQGAVWVPGWMRSMDAAFAAFNKNEPRLRALPMMPSEYVKRQIRVTPYPAEPTGWICEQAGKEVCLFSSDYPHVEGGRNPLKRFSNALEGCSEEILDHFYTRNFEDLMGAALA